MSISAAIQSSRHDTPPSINSSITRSKAKSSLRSLVACFKPKSGTEGEHNAASSSGTTNKNDDHDRALALSNLIFHDLDFMERASEKVKNYVKRVDVQIDQVRQKFKQLQTTANSETELHELRKDVAKLKPQISSQLIIHSADSNVRSNPWPDVNKASDEMEDKNLYKEPNFEHSIESEGLITNSSDLTGRLLQCLFCFLWFPPMSIIRKRVMVYLWMVHPFEDRIDEDAGNNIFDEFIRRGVIEPFYKKPSLVPDSCRMNLSVRSALATEAAKLYGFHPWCDTSSKFFFLGEGWYTSLINVSEAVIDGGPEEFEKIKHLGIVYLGRWKSSATHHIEITDPKILNGLKNMDELKFLSLRGISLITELPSFISELISLEILDLRACHNLEKVPDVIGSLENLTHLDMSECYFIDYMPKSLANLSSLQVLKGFFVGDSKDKRSCTLDELSRITKLRKLNIYTSAKDFPTERHLNALQKFKGLQKLTISWGGCSSLHEKNSGKEMKEDNAMESSGAIIHGNADRIVAAAKLTLPSSLQKLDLQGFRGKTTPTWLWPANLKQLKKLYIKGGELCGLGQFQNLNEEKWNVEILCLKYLSEFKTNWEDLKKSFPKLIYLQKIECPKLNNLFDESVGWMNIEKDVLLQEMAS